jgi:hypothetical protein
MASKAIMCSHTLPKAIVAIQESYPAGLLLLPQLLPVFLLPPAQPIQRYHRIRAISAKAPILLVAIDILADIVLVDTSYDF